MAMASSTSNGGGDLHTIPLTIGGKAVNTPTTFPVISPSTGQTLHLCSDADPSSAVAAVAAAAAALPTWSRTTPKQRRDVFLRAASLLRSRADELASYMATECAAVRAWADFNLDLARDFLLDVSGGLAASLAGTAPPTQDPSVAALVLREPYGVVVAIAPWNAPYILGVRGVLLPLAAGNTVVLKGSELSPRVMWAICDVFREAGLPAGALNFIASSRPNGAAVTEALVAHAEVKKINFTGSTAVGREIARLAGWHLKPVLLELGGKAPAIVWEDADLALAVDQCVLGAFLNAGQVCMATERIVVHKGVAAEFRERLKAAVGRFFPDAALLVQESTVTRNRALVRDAVAKGAEVVFGNSENLAEDEGPMRMRPVVLAGVEPVMDIYGQESFGPTVALFVVETEEEALRVANDTEYGLSAAVFTEDLRRGLRLARGIESGAVHVNNMTIHDEPALAHGGCKSSGFGRFDMSSLDEWTRRKVVTYRV